MSNNGNIELGPGLTMALLYLHDGQLSKAVFRWLETNSTARHCGEDLHALARLGYASLEGGVYLTPKGRWRAVEIARALAAKYHIRVPEPVSHRAREQGRYGRYTKGTFHPW